MSTLIQQTPEELDFSVTEARRALNCVPLAKTLRVHPDLDDLLDELADELYRIGIESDAVCGCAAGPNGHVCSAFLVFTYHYALHILADGLESAMAAHVENIATCVREFERFRPSEN